MTDATITIEDQNGIKVIKISGQLDESNVDEKIKDVYKIVEQNPQGTKLLFDLENLAYLNSKSIGYLTDLYGKVTEGGGKMVIAKAKSNIVDILQVVGLTQLIKMCATTEEAKTELGTAVIPQSTATPTVPVAPVAPQTPATPVQTPVAPVPPAPAPTQAPAPTPAPATPIAQSIPTQTTTPVAPATPTQPQSTATTTTDQGTYTFEK